MAVVPMVVPSSARGIEIAFCLTPHLAPEKIRIQRYGPDAHVDIDIEVKPSLTVDKAHKISQQVRREIQKAWPAVRDVTVHIEPYYANDHYFISFFGDPLFCRIVRLSQTQVLRQPLLKSNRVLMHNGQHVRLCHNRSLGLVP